jgi:hypothetical protein
MEKIIQQIHEEVLKNDLLLKILDKAIKDEEISLSFRGNVTDEEYELIKSKTHIQISQKLISKLVYLMDLKKLGESGVNI